MAVTSVSEIGEPREAVDDQTGLVTVTRGYEAYTDSPLDDSLVVLASPLVVAKFATYVSATSTAPTVRCIRRQAKQFPDDTQKWVVTIWYSSKWLDEARANPNPQLRPAKIRFGTKTYTKAMTADLNGVPVLNVNGETFENPPSNEVRRLTMSIRRFQLNWDPVAMNAFVGALNSLAFFGFDASRARCNQAEADSDNEGEFSGWSAAFEFEFLNADENIREWQLVQISQGYKDRIGGSLSAVTLPDGTLASVPIGGAIRDIFGTSGQRPSRAVLLDALGAQLMLTGNGSITNIVVASNVATVTATAHGMNIGSIVAIAGNAAVPSANYTILTTTTNSFTFAVTAANNAGTAGGTWALVSPGVQYQTFKRAGTKNFDDLNLL